MKSFSKKALVLGVMLAVGATAQAAYLGQLQVTSQASQSFQATFLVHDVSPTGSSLTARLAPAETYSKYGITMPETAKGLNLALINKSPLTLRISSNRPAVERAFPLLVELNEGGHVTVRQYNIHIGATGSVEPVEVVSMAAAPITAAIPVAKSAPESKPSVKNASATKAPVSTTAAKTEMTPLERMQAKNYDLSKPVLVEAGYTPWSLGVLYQKRYPHASVNQVLVALAIHNPEAFPAGNVRQLKAGAKVTAPSASLVESINAQTAREIVQKGLSIEEVAQRPAPIKEVKQEAPKHKKPLPSIQTAPVKHLPVTKEEIQSDVKAAEPAPITPAPQSGDLTATDKAQQPAENLPVTSEAPVEAIPENPPSVSESVEAQESTSPQDAMPTLEIMTEEEVPVEEESTSWFWYLLIVLMLGAAGFIYWRTKQGRYVDFQSFKRVMNKGKAPVHEEPTIRQAPQAPRAAQPSAPTSSFESVSHAPHEEPRVEPRPVAVQPASVASTATVAAAQKPVSQQAASANVFDLVADDEPVQVQPTPAQAEQKAAAADDHGMKDSLDMARSFISIGAKNEAIALLQEVLQKGSPADKAQAEALLKQVHERA